MKDFEITNKFISDSKEFADALVCLHHGLLTEGSGFTGIDACVRELRRAVKETTAKGEALADDVREVCTDLMAFPSYFAMWAQRLESIEFPLEDEDMTDSCYWADLLNDDNDGIRIATFVGNMRRNIDDVLSWRDKLAQQYGIPASTPEPTPEPVEAPQEQPKEEEKSKEEETFEEWDTIDFYGKERKNYLDIDYEKLFKAVKSALPDNMTEDYFRMAVWTANYGAIYRNSKKANLRFVISKIMAYHIKGSENKRDYRETAAKSMGINDRQVTKANPTKDFVEKVKNAMKWPI